MGDEAKKTYKLFALPLSAKNIDAAAGARFSRATARYVLIYTHDTAPENSVEIGIEEVSRLSKEDYDWLTDCNFLILAESAKENESKIAADISKRLDVLESELKKEKEKQKEG